MYKCAQNGASGQDLDRLGDGRDLVVARLRAELPVLVRLLAPAVGHASARRGTGVVIETLGRALVGVQGMDMLFFRADFQHNENITEFTTSPNNTLKAVKTSTIVKNTLILIVFIHT